MLNMNEMSVFAVFRGKMKLEACIHTTGHAIHTLLIVGVGLSQVNAILGAVGAVAVGDACGAATQAADAFHGLYGGGPRGTIPRLPLGPGERCVEIVQA